MRCVLHASLYLDNMFLTLTYDEKKSGYNNELCYTDIQKFKKRYRQYVQRLYKKKIQIFNVHEYGKNGKKHWHLIVFNHEFSDKKIHSTKKDIPLYTSKKLVALWRHGFVTIGDVTEASAMYQAQYMQKDIKNGNTNERKSKSNHSGLGKEYFLSNYEQILRLGHIPFNGQSVPIPRYFLKIAHKHWAHFNDQSYFHDLCDRKRVYTSFTRNEQDPLLSSYYSDYRDQRKQKLDLKEQRWKITVENSNAAGIEPDFVQALKNNLYDLKNKTTQENF